MKKYYSLIAVILLVCVITFLIKTDKRPYTVINTDSIEEYTNNNNTVFLYFYSKDCIACSKLKPIISKIEIENNDIIYGIDVKGKENDLDMIVEKYKINKTPTLIKLNKNKEISRIEGLTSKKKLEYFFNENL